MKFVQIFTKISQNDIQNENLNIKDEYNKSIRKCFNFISDIQNKYNEILKDNTNFIENKPNLLKNIENSIIDFTHKINSSKIEIMKILSKDCIKLKINYYNPYKNTIKNTKKSILKNKTKRFLMLINSINYENSLKNYLPQLKEYLNFNSEFLKSLEFDNLSNNTTKIAPKTYFYRIFNIKNRKNSFEKSENEISFENINENQEISGDFVEVIEGDMIKEIPTIKRKQKAVLTEEQKV